MMNPKDILTHLREEKQSILNELNEISEIDDETILTDRINAINSRLDALRKLVHQNRSQMIAYDLRNCNEIIKEIDKKILEHRSEDAQKDSDFSFKIKGSTSEEIPQKSIQRNKALRSSNDDDLLDKLLNNVSGFQDLIGETLKLEKNQIENKDIVLKNLCECHVQIHGIGSSLRLVNLKNTKIFTGPIKSSIYIENCHHCNFQIVGQQVRIHDCSECDIYLYVTSRTIIEDSTKIRFGPYDWDYEHKELDFKRSGFETSPNNWCQIDDFNCLFSKSKNWSLIE
ncbi:Tubulin-specific chaperone C [Sarcoptes scabiei]|uniref:Tubulin-specific chaperone C n=1 Tax=Sarcoptes scabiei TaxID=52283 RepID=A0A834VDD3_SARSC|nr:Tubulin-specific chaperone C [Sarcoptes scabiei]